MLLPSHTDGLIETDYYFPSVDGKRIAKKYLFFKKQ